MLWNELSAFHLLFYEGRGTSVECRKSTGTQRMNDGGGETILTERQRRERDHSNAVSMFLPHSEEATVDSGRNVSNSLHNREQIPF